MDINHLPLSGIEKSLSEVFFKGGNYLFAIFVERKKSLGFVFVVKRFFLEKDMSDTEFLLIFIETFESFVLLYILL